MAVALEAAALEVATAAHYHPSCATKSTPVSTPGEVATHSFWLDDDHSSTYFVLGSFAFPAERAVNEGICMSRYCSLAGARALIKNRWVGAAFGNSTDDTELIPAPPAHTM